MRRNIHAWVRSIVLLLIHCSCQHSTSLWFLVLFSPLHPFKKRSKYIFPPLSASKLIDGNFAIPALPAHYDDVTLIASILCTEASFIFHRFLLQHNSEYCMMFVQHLILKSSKVTLNDMSLLINNCFPNPIYSRPLPKTVLINGINTRAIVI